MKNRSIAIILLYIFFITGCSSLSSKQSKEYSVKKDGVYWTEYSYLSKKQKFEPIFSADVNTFRVIEGAGKSKLKYASDRNYVYLDGTPIPYANPSTFLALGRKYAKDSNSVFYEGRRISGIQPNNFKVVKDTITVNYGKSGAIGLYKGKVFKLCDAESFLLDSKYPAVWSYDKDCVYYKGRLVESNERLSFEVLSYYFSKDSNYVYFKNKRIPNADPATFKSLTYSINSSVVVAKDANSCWNRTAEQIDCSSKKKGLSSKPLIYMSDAEIVEAGTKYARGLFLKKEKSKKEAFDKASETIAAVLSHYNEKVLTDKGVLSIDLRELPIGFSYILKSTIADPIGRDDRLTYILKDKRDGKLYFDVFHSQMKGVLSEIWDVRGNVIQKARGTKISPTESKFSQKQCRFVIGLCREKIVRRNKRNKVDFEYSQLIESKYLNGSWERFVGNSQREVKLKQRSIFDTNGIPLYLIRFSDESIDNEYVRVE